MCPHFYNLLFSLKCLFLLLCTSLPYSFVAGIFYSFVKWPVIYLDSPLLWTLTRYAVYFFFNLHTEKVTTFGLKFYEF